MDSPIKEGASFDPTFDRGYESALRAGICGGNEEATYELIKAGADINVHGLLFGLSREKSISGASLNHRGCESADQRSDAPIGARLDNKEGISSIPQSTEGNNVDGTPIIPKVGTESLTTHYYFSGLSEYLTPPTSEIREDITETGWNTASSWMRVPIQPPANTLRLRRAEMVDLSVRQPLMENNNRYQGCKWAPI